MAVTRSKKHQKASPWAFLKAPAPPKTNSHPISSLGYIFIALVFVQWVHATSLAVKLQCVVGAALFSVTEYNFYTMTVEAPDGTVSLKPFAGRPGHTTIHQYIMNVFYIPILIHGYHALIGSTWVRILLFPINIWVLEIIQGYTLIFLIGYDAFFHGNIKLWYIHYWLLMGAALELVVLPYVLPLTYRIVEYI
ncbi:hypothetical protein BGZ99_000112 [Dissophora globulifera]|uniref:Uncharacterized protein n=1 Tax=Dissophora globulifera TaxID=979702 RepID=A0A9P6RPU4_9FUNG|nr:hypothetical protein BGZ99_000112 [Dissophora globulifera]